MNHIPTHILSAEARPLTRRAMAKLRTRQIVLEAAKRLFTERGYQEATVRDIASAAGMSTGAVFANFTDKADLFNEVLKADAEALAQRIRASAQSEQAPDAAVLNLLGQAYEFHLAQLPLLQAAESVAWTQEAPSGDGGQRDVIGLVEAALRRGVEHGELAKGTDVALAADLIWNSYLANYRLAVFDGWQLGQLRDRLGRQIAVILAGFRV